MQESDENSGIGAVKFKQLIHFQSKNNLVKMSGSDPGQCAEIYKLVYCRGSSTHLTNPIGNMVDDSGSETHPSEGDKEEIYFNWQMGTKDLYYVPSRSYCML